MLIYRTNDKYCIYTKDDIKKAYNICFGHNPNDVEYMTFLNNIWGKGIRKAENLSCYHLAAEGHRAFAVKCYRDEYGCTLTEAKQKMDEYETLLKGI